MAQRLTQGDVSLMKPSRTILAEASTQRGLQMNPPNTGRTQAELASAYGRSDMNPQLENNVQLSMNAESQSVQGANAGRHQLMNSEEAKLRSEEATARSTEDQFLNNYMANLMADEGRGLSSNSLIAVGQNPRVIDDVEITRNNSTLSGMRNNTLSS